MKGLAIVLFLGGLLLGVRVMFFGVQRRLDDERLMHRKWPLALAAFLVAFGALLYARTSGGTAGVTGRWGAVVVLVSLAAGATAWWFVQRSSMIPSSDPEDDPRYRFQGHVARVTEAIEETAGRIVFDFDGKRYELRARWSPDSEVRDKVAVPADSEVVIDRVEGEVAYVEPWTVVEERL